MLASPLRKGSASLVVSVVAPMFFPAVTAGAGLVKVTVLLADERWVMLPRRQQ